ncbi:hypothetical protein OEZ60_16995 [Defluviimonas sp. WL0024]|uniref:Glyceraldehyde-3-phosphate dehydrogenase n=2 Tax=Albidovulum TaxID=205889 RepID=A0ABT3IZG9_9RHOB|nr:MULTISPECIES: hypothetical protein [Defluviimonas]MCU9849699.1 hypothetical protein [Defluviimonas sp. WL0024]MCW3780786.1 hypothetical protein [Defluviimonas salinarum]
MTNRIAIVLAALVAAFFLVDHFWLNLGAPLFLGRKLLDLVEFLAIWR